MEARPGAGVYVNGSSDIRFEAMDFHGQMDGDLTRDGSGIAVRESTKVTITGSLFHELSGGISHINADGLTVTDNRMHDLRSDGVLGTGSDDV